MKITGQRVAGKVAIITGAAVGMGAAHARLLAAEGAKVVICDISDKEGRATAKEIGENALFVHLDVANEEQWKNAVAAAEAAFGPINVLVNNAGIVALANIDQMTETEYRRLIDVNQIGPFLGMRSVVGSMRKARGGSIINISSVAGFAGLEKLSGYTATKFAIRGMDEGRIDRLGIGQHPG
ncbi:SDR family NAD(P)-dependent oxidoreductase [Massilia niabensis]|uniref:SDR family NAD(P)-dependent oxidoreductase n=1 Tax=Massilia niabensis TaxID=544910 RepID=A0ABW0LDS9_9BURK